MQTFSVIPASRHDLLVADAATNQPRRLTLYSGTAWLGSPPSVSETTILGIRAYRTSGSAVFAHPSDPVQFFLPDSLSYRREAIGSAVVSATAGLTGFQDTNSAKEATVLLGTGVTFVDDPQRPGIAWLGITVTLTGHVWAVSYQVSVSVAPDAVV